MFTDPLAQAISPGVCLLKENSPQNGKGSLDRSLQKYKLLEPLLEKLLTYLNEI
jgi:hypothetical protein